MAAWEQVYVIASSDEETWAGGGEAAQVPSPGFLDASGCGRPVAAAAAHRFQPSSAASALLGKRAANPNPEQQQHRPQQLQQGPGGQVEPSSEAKAAPLCAAEHPAPGANSLPSHAVDLINRGPRLATIGPSALPRGSARPSSTAVSGHGDGTQGAGWAKRFKLTEHSSGRGGAGAFRLAASAS